MRTCFVAACLWAVLLSACFVRGEASAADGTILSLSFDKDSPASQRLDVAQSQAVPGIRGMARRIAKGGLATISLPIAARLFARPAGSVLVWWRPEWTIEQTQESFGRSSASITRGFYGLPLDRPFHTGQWHLLTTTWNKDNVVRHYVDGELVERNRLEREPVDKKAKLWLGGPTVWSFSQRAPGAPWAMTVDEFRIVSTALPVEQIQAEYLAGKIACGQFQPTEIPGDRCLDVRPGERMLVERRTRQMYGFPAILKDKKGRLYRKAKNGSEASTLRQWAISSDGGHNWISVPEDRRILSLAFSTRGVQTKNGGWMFANFAPGGNQRQTDVKQGVTHGIMKAVDKDGSTLPDRPIRLTHFPYASYPASDRMLRANDGGLLGSVFHFQGKGEGPGNSRLVVIKSSRDGLVWQPLSSVVEKPPRFFREGLDEATLFHAANGDLVVIARTGLPLIIVRSHDDGKTWEPWRLLGIDGVFPRSIKLSCGLMACAVGRPDINLLVSLDEDARHWDMPFQLHNANRMPHNLQDDWHQHGTFYAGVVELEPGRLVVVYDTAGTVRKPGGLPQCELWLQEVFVDSIATFSKVRGKRLSSASKQLTFDTHWTTPHVAGWNDSPYAATSHDGAEVRFRFRGTGLVGQVMQLLDGGEIEVWIDGKLRRTVNTVGSHTNWLVRRVLARKLSPGEHEARLVARCRQLPLPLLPSIQELMRKSAIEAIRDSRGKTRVVLHAVEPFTERSTP